jgi:hypothetical protein
LFCSKLIRWNLSLAADVLLTSLVALASSDLPLAASLTFPEGPEGI